jgi:type VI secretion system secreted protein VgrG
MASIHSGIHATLGIDGNALHVLAYSLRRQLFAVDSLEVTISSTGEQLPEPATLVGKDARFALRRDIGGEFYFSGVVVMACQSEGEDDVRTLNLEISPELWHLSRRSHHRVFQNMTVKDVTEQVLTSAGVAAVRNWSLDGNHPSRLYITQYNETDLEFVQRILAEEGIYFATDDTDAQSTVHFSDNPTGFGDVDGPSTLQFLREFGWEGADDTVSKLTLTERIASDKATIREFDWNSPKVDLTSTVEAQDGRAHAAESYRFPGRATDLGQLKTRTNCLLEALRVDRLVLLGETGSFALRPGLRFSVDGHPYARINAGYLVTEVRVNGKREHQHAERRAEGESYVSRVEFSAIPTTEGRYRPKPRSPMRKIPGLQTAVVTGPSGDEIHTNEHGQVTVLFPWEGDKPADHNSSSWKRTSQVPLGGSMLLPRMHWEVAVSAVEGDVDHRMVMSRFYNADTMPPYALPEKKAAMSLQTNTTPGGGTSNEIRMSDNKGEEEMFFNGSYDMSVNVGNNATESVGVNYKTQIGANHTLKVANSMMANVGSNQTINVSVNHKTSVATLSVDEIGGDHTLTIGGKRTMMIGGDHRRTVAADSTETVGASRIEAVVGAVSDATMANMTQTAGAALVEVTAASRSLIAASARSETTGAAKVILAKGGRGVEASSLAVTVGGAVLNIVKGNRTAKAGAALNDTVAGAQIIKADNVTFEAETALSITMGASTITLTPASVIIAGASIKVDANSVDLGIIMNN